MRQLVFAGMAMAFFAVCADEVATEQPDAWAKIVDPDRAEGATLMAYDVGDYVQNGLVAHFDGIRNIGADLPHAPSATTWVNLVTGAPNATFHHWNGSDDTSDWVDNGYNFVSARAIMASPGVALGEQFTIQLATSVDYLRQDYGDGVFPNFFSAPNDFCLYYSNNGKSAPSSAFFWKTEPYGAPDGAQSRPQGSWTEGTYITAMMDSEKQRLIFGTDRDVGFIRARTTTVAIPETQWRWGGGSTASRSLHGVIHSVRLYNRPLTNEELVQNRKVDDARFRGASIVGGNVLVRSGVSGAEGNEASGCYEVNGEHTFTTPQSATVGDAVFSPVGYQLETWNSLSNAWKVAGTSTNTFFTYTNCLARAKVRLTWLWEMTGGKMELDADAYAPFGLVGNFDGIRNVGLGMAHDNAAKTWKNLAGSLDATHNPISRDGAWEGDGYRFVGGDAWRWGAIDLGASFTVQSVCDVYVGEQLVGGNNFNGSENCWGTPFGSANDVGNFYMNGRSASITFKCDGIMGGDWSTGTRAQVWWGNGDNLTAMVDFDRTAITTETDWPEFKDAYKYKGAIGSRTYYFGGIDTGNTIANRAARCLIGTIYATRVYNRVLSPQEMKWNRFLDNARFRGLHTVAPTGLVQVVGSGVKGHGADDGLWLLRDGSVTVSAPETVELNGVVHTCTGYRIEAMDAANAAFVTTARGTERTYTFTADTTCNRRIVWEWRAENRLRSAADYDVDDYVQEGLVVHYDGIRNVAAGIPHDAAAGRWRDVSGRKNHMRVVQYAGNSENAIEPVWTNGMAVSFNNDSYARMTSAVAIGKEVTVEQAMDIDFAGQTKNFPNYFAVYNDYGIFTRGKATSLEWKHDSICGGSRPKVSGWQGKYLTAVASATRSYLTQGTTLGGGQARSAFGTFGYYRWSVGGAHEGAANDRHSKGLFYSTRLYNRPLTEAELAHNRKVDDIRFRGMVVTNVVVASAHDEAHGVETNGVYEVEGSWTFTAAPMELASGKTARPVGYTIERLTATGWGDKTSHKGTSYTYTAGSEPVRITWRYDSGLVIMVR